MATKTERLNLRFTEEFNKAFDAFIDEWKPEKDLNKSKVIVMALSDYLVYQNKKMIEEQGNLFYIHLNQEHFTVDDIQKVLDQLTWYVVENKKEGNAGAAYLIKQLQGALLEQSIYEKNLVKYGDLYNERYNNLRINKREG